MSLGDNLVDMAVSEVVITMYVRKIGAVVNLRPKVLARLERLCGRNVIYGQFCVENPPATNPNGRPDHAST